MIPTTRSQFCPVCGRTTVHRRRFVPLDRIAPERRVSYPVVDGRAILPPECSEHGGDEGRGGPPDGPAQG